MERQKGTNSEMLWPCAEVHTVVKLLYQNWSTTSTQLKWKIYCALQLVVNLKYKNTNHIDSWESSVDLPENENLDK